MDTQGNFFLRLLILVLLSFNGCWSSVGNRCSRPTSSSSSQPPITRQPATTKPATTEQQIRIYDIANKYSKENSKMWSKSTRWNGKFLGMSKCNLYVDDVLTEAGTKEIPRKNGRQLLANDWADLKSTGIKNNENYKLVPKNEKPQKGDIIAFKRIGQSGHVGIMSSEDKFISALDDIVKELTVQGFEKNKSIVETVIWRYVGP